LVKRVLPELAASRDPMTAKFQDAVLSNVSQSLPFKIPVLQRHPSTWPSINRVMDEFWSQAVVGERALDIKESDIPSSDNIPP
jgi:hypothetical protein